VSRRVYHAHRPEDEAYRLSQAALTLIAFGTGIVGLYVMLLALSA
jgi:hypothetical protein